MEPTNGGEKAQLFLINAIMNRRAISFGDLEALLGETYLLSVFAHIEQIAREEEIARASKRFIARYFGGRPHKEKVLAWVENGPRDYPELFKKENYDGKSFISHMLLAGEIERLGSQGIVVLYQNMGVKVRFKNLLPFFGETTKLKIGGTVLCHNSSIIMTRVDVDLVAELLEIQAEDDDFMAVLRKISTDGIDHTEILSFPRAKKVFEYI